MNAHTEVSEMSREFDLAVKAIQRVYEKSEVEAVQLLAGSLVGVMTDITKSRGGDPSETLIISGNDFQREIVIKKLGDHS